MSAIDTLPFKTEEQCIEYLRLFREKNNLVCDKCGGDRFTWCEAERRWTCRSCKHVTYLTGGTIMHGSNLPLLYWFTAIHLLSENPKISSKEVQRVLGHKRYQPIWEMMNKIKERNVKAYTDVLENQDWSELDIGELDDILIKEADFAEILEDGMDGRSVFKHKLYKKNGNNS